MFHHSEARTSLNNKKLVRSTLIGWSPVSHRGVTEQKIFTVSHEKIRKFFQSENFKTIFKKFFPVLIILRLISTYKTALRPNTRSFNNKIDSAEIEKFEELVANNVDIPQESDAPTLLRLSSTKGKIIFNKSNFILIIS